MSKKLEAAKLLFDPKVDRIIKSFKYSPKTVKEAAAELNEKPTRLYYHINKLLELDLLKITEEKMVNNFMEKYYSSAHLYSKDFRFSFEGDFAVENKDFLINHILISFNQGIDALKSDLENPDGLTESNAVFSEVEVNLTMDEWHQVHREITRLIKSRDQKPAHDTKEYIFALLAYNSEPLKKNQK
ncbi:ArsR family transcriptional regulator [Peribacillus sp. SCS-26]|uniref:ArsR family transcriptional regulator n=1 Tax=Paraperibacillus marinus TaxID=3115295 RepID=UPI003905B178